jgi:hypothetical protein
VACDNVLHQVSRGALDARSVPGIVCVWKPIGAWPQRHQRSVLAPTPGTWNSAASAWLAGRPAGVMAELTVGSPKGSNPASRGGGKSCGRPRHNRARTLSEKSGCRDKGRGGWPSRKERAGEPGTKPLGPLAPCHRATSRLRRVESQGDSLQKNDRPSRKIRRRIRKARRTG